MFYVGNVGMTCMILEHVVIDFEILQPFELEKKRSKNALKPISNVIRKNIQ